MTSKPSRNRFGWLSEEEDPVVEEVRREEAPAPPPAGPVAETLDPPVGVPGVTRRRRRNRAKNPKALRNDPERMMAGARIRRNVRRRVEQALADPAVVGDEGTNYSLLVESLLVRWLREVGYPPEESS
ncbi:MAG: hypothetical protein M3P49_00820 [Actinomycetota bacterium]|nr:hypothetical protein [Actinomycetota bacterium]